MAYFTTAQAELESPKKAEILTETPVQRLIHSFDYYAYLDASYNYLANKNKFISGTYDRVFDIQPNGFTLQQASFDIARLSDPGLGGEIFMIGGADANRIAPSGWDPYFGSQTLALSPYNVFLQYAFTQVKLQGGVLDTLIGYESNDPSKNSNFSNSILDQADPASNIGLRSIFAVNEKLKLFLGLGNGPSTLRHPTQLTMLEYAAEYSVSDQTTLGFHANNGNYPVLYGSVVGPMARFNLFDFIWNYQATKNLAFAVNADYFSQVKGIVLGDSAINMLWQGVAGYIVYDLTEQWRVAARGEVFDDRDGFAFGVRQNWREATLTLQYQPRKYLLFRAETRRDLSNVSSFVTTRNGLTDFQQSFALQGMYLFL